MSTMTWNSDLLSNGSILTFTALSPTRLIEPIVRAATTSKKPQRQPRRDGERDGQRQQHAHARVDRDRAHVGAHEAAHERHRQERGDDGQRREDRRSADFVDRAGNDRRERLVRREYVVAVDVLDHDDRVVDQDADGEDEREQRHAVEREAPRPGGEQRDRQREDHRAADDRRLASAEAEEDERDDGGGREQELLDELLRLVVGGFAVVARLGDLDVGGNDGVAQDVDALHHGARDVDCVLTWLLGDGDAHRVELASFRPGHCVPHVARRRRRAVAHGRDFLQVHRPAVAHRDHQLGDVARIAQERPRLDLHGAVAGEEVADRRTKIGRLQCLAQVRDRHAVDREAARIDLDQDRAAGATDRRDLARSGHALQIDLDAVRDALEVERARRAVAAPQRERNDRHVVDAFRLDDRRTHAQAFRQPVGVGVDRVVQAHQRLGARHAHLELHGDDRHAGSRHREHVLDARDLREDLLRRYRDHALDVLRRGAGKGNEDVGHRDVDLGLLLARRHDHRERAQEQRDQRKQRRDLRGLEVRRDAARDAEGRLHGGPHIARAAACGSSTTRSPADSPLRTSMRSPAAGPRRTCRSNGRASPATT
jgi:hypothetical protein